jgi:hypothetical protein
MVICGTACQSKTAKNRNPSSEKVTAAPAGPQVQVFVQVEFSPRRPQELELGILSPGVKACFLTYAGEQKPPTLVTFEGKIDYQGRLDAYKVGSSEAALKTCLMGAAPAVFFGRGRIGEFKLSIATGPDLLKEAKGMLITATETKKFE